MAHGLISNLTATIILYVRIDKKKKLLVTTFLQALGIARNEIIPLFYRFDIMHLEKGEFYQDLMKPYGQRIEKGMLTRVMKKHYVANVLPKKLLQNCIKLVLNHFVRKIKS